MFTCVLLMFHILLRETQGRAVGFSLLHRFVLELHSEEKLLQGSQGVIITAIIVKLIVVLQDLSMRLLALDLIVDETACRLTVEQCLRNCVDVAGLAVIDKARMSLAHSGVKIEAVSGTVSANQDKIPEFYYRLILLPNF